MITVSRYRVTADVFRAVPLEQVRRKRTVYVVHSLLYHRPHGVVAGGNLFYCRSFFLTFFSFAKESPR